MATPQNRGENGRFLPGNNANPGRRPKGLSRQTRDLLGDDGEPLVRLWLEIALDAQEVRGQEEGQMTEHISLGSESPDAAALFFLNDRLGRDVRVRIYAEREWDGPPVLALDVVGELRHTHLDDGSNVYEVGDNCAIELPVYSALEIQHGQLNVHPDSETVLTVYAIGDDGQPEE